jgi:MYXO-CTERM domain-containing protein
MGTECDEASGLCVPQCFEGGCAPGFECTGGRCIDSACAMRSEPCPSGTLCRAGVCRAPCEGVVCPSGEICAGGACIDPCEGVICPANQVCIADRPGALTVCGPSCNCAELAAPLCPAGEACDEREGSPTEGECVDPGCETAICGPTEVCTGGTCVDGCAGVTCPFGQACMEGECAADLCSRVVCPTDRPVCHGGECFEACVDVMCDPGEICRDGACIPDPCAGVDCGTGFRCSAGTCIPDGTTPLDGGGASGVDGGDGEGRRPPGDSGCACRTAEAPGNPLGVALTAIVAVITLARRRRRR